MHSRRPIASHVPVVPSSMGGDRCTSQSHAWGSPKAGGCQWRPSGRRFDAGASATTRAAARHLFNDSTQPLRRGRTSWMPTALGSVIWEFRQEASSQPGQGVAGREEGSASRTKGSNSRKPDRRFRRTTPARSTSARRPRARKNAARDSLAASTVCSKRHHSAHVDAAAPHP
jgi:hypothetical protein